MKDPVSTIGVQSYGYIALTKGISALKRSSYEIDPGLKSDTMLRAGAIKQSLNSDFFIEETGYYALASEISVFIAMVLSRSRRAMADMIESLRHRPH